MAHTQLISATTTLFLLLLLSFSPPTTTTTTTTVLDIEGNPLEVGSKYRMGFAGAFYFFGGLTMISKRSQPECPQFVGASPLPSDNGPPVMFFPAVNSTEKTISLSSNLNIAFSGPSLCGQTMWRLSAINGGENGFLNVITDGVVGDEIISKMFKIEKVDDEHISAILPYKIRYCPDHQGNEIICGDLGLWYDHEGIWLGINPNQDLEPFQVYFMKV